MLIEYIDNRFSNQVTRIKKLFDLVLKILIDFIADSEVNSSIFFLPLGKSFIHMKNLFTLILFVVVTSLIVQSCGRKSDEKNSNIEFKSDKFKVIGYLSSKNLDKLDIIEFNALTHLNLAFANPNKNGTFVFNEEQKLERTVNMAHKAGVKVFISIAGGGTNKELPANWLSVLQPENRTVFIQEIVDFVMKYNLDGVDVDIEWNLMPTIGNLYTPFVIELKKSLKRNKKEITSALNVSGLHESVTQEALLAYDFINIMVYDKTGPWRPDHPGPHSPYSYAEEALEYWTKERNIPNEKLTLGVPFYGHDFDKIGSISYGDLVAIDTANAYKDQTGEIYYDGIPTIIKKTQFAMESFGGIMIWELGHDAQNDLSLLKAINKTIVSRSVNKD